MTINWRPNQESIRSFIYLSLFITDTLVDLNIVNELWCFVYSTLGFTSRKQKVGGKLKEW